MRVLVAYASKHGSTQGMAGSLVDRLRERGVGAETASVDEIDDLRGYDVVVVASAIRAGAWMKSAVDFADRNRRALERVPVWLFGSGPPGSEPRFPSRVMATAIVTPENSLRDWDGICRWADEIARSLVGSAA